MKDKLTRAMRAPDDWAIEMDYTGSQTVNRTVSPIRFVGQDRFLAYCFTHEGPRTFLFAKCKNVELVAAHTVLAPVK